MKKDSSKLFLFVCAVMMIFSLSAFTKDTDPVSKGLPPGDGHYIRCIESVPLGTNTWVNYYGIFDLNHNLISTYSIAAAYRCSVGGGPGDPLPVGVLY